MSKSEDYRKRYTIRLTEKERNRLLNTHDTHLSSIVNKLYEAKGVKRMDEPEPAQCELGLQSKMYQGHYWDETHGGVKMLRVSNGKGSQQDLDEIAWFIPTFHPETPARLMRRWVGPWEEVPPSEFSIKED